jgi:hypothetical protein
VPRHTRFCDEVPGMQQNIELTFLLIRIPTSENNFMLQINFLVPNCEFLNFEFVYY